MYSTGIFKFQLYFINIKIYFREIHGQHHENCLLEAQFLKITSLKRPILQDGLYFIFRRSAAWCCAVPSFLSLSHNRVFRTEQSELQECCNYRSKDGLPDKWHNQWTIEIQAAATSPLLGVGGNPSSEHLWKWLAFPLFILYCYWRWGTKSCFKLSPPLLPPSP